MLAGVALVPAARASAVASAGPPATGASVTTDKGVVIGTVGDGTRSFSGIPFAAPPVGKDRWAPPKPAAPWSQPLDATKLAAACEQGVNTSFGTPKVSVSEDCLHLNVYTPTTSTQKRPVMVWFHGGGYTGGQGGDYDGGPFARDHDAIVVTVNYRLGVFGFLATSGLSATSSTHTSGNYGLEDQQAALQWVQRNIAAFGGDPQKVTIAGQSAGAGSVCFQTVAPKSRGLFAGAIMMSGNCAFRTSPTPTLSQSESQGDKYAATVGCSGSGTSEADCLRSKSVDELLTSAGGTSTGGATALPLAPIVDGKFIPQDPGKLIRQGKFNRVPVMSGNTSDEGTTFVFLNYELKGMPVTADGYRAALQLLIPSANPDTVMARYPLSQYPTPSQAVAVARTDSSVCQLNASAQVYATKVPTYVYVFADRTTPSPIPKLPSLNIGVGHGNDIQYVFQNQGIPLVSVTPSPFTATQQAVTNSVTDYWAQFMKTGDPGHAGGPTWPRFTPTSQKRIVYGTDATTVDASNFSADHQCGFWLKQTS